MKDRRGQLSGDFIHIRDHQQQSLAGGEGGGKCAGLQGTVYSAGSSPFGLHFGYQRDSAPDVLLSGRALGVRNLAHV